MQHVCVCVYKFLLFMYYLLVILDVFAEFQKATTY
jgi:hypothetical protein